MVVVVAWGILATIVLVVIIPVGSPLTGLDLGLWPFWLWLGMVVAGPLWLTHRLYARR